MEKNKEDKIYIINLNNIVYGIIFLLILISIIYFISKGMGDTQVKIQSTGIYKEDQIMAIEAVANNVTGRINNVIAVTAIFFAVIVSSVSVFQFVKVKDFDKEIFNLLKKTKILNGELNLSNDKIEELKDEITKIYNEKDMLKIDNIKTQLELNIYKINETFYKPGTILSKTLNLIDKSINLINEYPNIIDPIDISKLYYKKAYVAYDIGSNSYAIEMGNIALNKVKEKYPHMDIEDLFECSYVEELGRFIINIHNIEGDFNLVEKIIEKIRNVLDFQLNDRLAFSCYQEFEDVMKLIKENYTYYGEYFLKKFKEYYEKGTFDEFKENTEFKTLMKSWNIEI